MPISKKDTIINKNNLGSLLDDLYLQGFSYTEMVEKVLALRGIQVSRMSVSRYFQNRKDKLLGYKAMNDVEIQEMLQYNYNRFLNHSNQILINMRDDVDEAIEHIDVLEIDTKSKRELKKAIRSIYTETSSSLKDLQVDILTLTDIMRENSESINQFIIDWSSKLCTECNRKVAKTINDHLNKCAE